MGAPVAAAAALNTRTGRKVLTGIIAILALLIAVVMTPLFAIPFALAGATVTAEVGRGGPAVSGEWGYPLEGDYFKGRGFGWNPVDNCAFCSKNHKGYDMSRGCGATIYAAGPGRVGTAGSSGTFGNTVRIEHGDGIDTIYAHMQWNSLLVTVGQQVTAGTPLGAEGRTGNSTGCHLHFEVRESGTPIPTEPFMAARGLPLK